MGKKVVLEMGYCGEMGWLWKYFFMVKGKCGIESYGMSVEGDFFEGNMCGSV